MTRYYCSTKSTKMDYQVTTQKTDSTIHVKIHAVRKTGPKGKATKRTGTVKLRLNRKAAAEELSLALETLFPSGGWFCTLNARPEVSYEQLKEASTRFLRRMRYVYKKYGMDFDYVCAVCIGEGGQPHIHIAISSMNLDQRGMHAFVKREWGRVLDKYVDEHEQVKVEQMTGAPYDELGKYLIGNLTITAKKCNMSDIPRWSSSARKVEQIQTIISNKDGYKLPEGFRVVSDTEEVDCYGFFYRSITAVTITQKQMPLIDPQKTTFFKQELECAKKRGMREWKCWSREALNRSIRNNLKKGINPGKEVYSLLEQVSVLGLRRLLLDGVQDEYLTFRKGKVQTVKLYRFSRSAFQNLTEEKIQKIINTEKQVKETIEKLNSAPDTQYYGSYTDWHWINDHCIPELITNAIGKVVGPFFCTPDGKRKRIFNSFGKQCVSLC